MESLKIGIIGAGANCHARHIPGLQEQDGVAVQVVCNRSEGSSRQVADKWGIPEIATDWKAVVARDDLDAICIGTWPYLHKEISMAALQAGKHVLCEARMTMDYAEALALQETVNAHADLVFQVVPSPLTLAIDDLIMEQIQNGAIGTLKNISVRGTQNIYTNPDLPISWRQDRALNGKNPLLMGIFHESVLRWMGSNPQWIEARAQTWTTQRPDQTGKLTKVEMPDELYFHGAWENGVQYHGHFSGVSWGEPVLQMNCAGTKGEIQVDIAKSTVVTITSEGTRILAENYTDGWRVEADFIHSIRTGKPVTHTNVVRGVQYMQFADAVDESWRHDGRKISL